MQNNLPKTEFSPEESVPEEFLHVLDWTAEQVEADFQKSMAETTEAAFLSAREFSQEFGITSRRIRVLAAQGRIPGAFQHATRGWLIPRDFKLERGKRGPKVTF